MFKEAKITLTVIYSAIFVALFLLFGTGIYIWFNRSLGEGYITEVRDRRAPYSSQFTQESRDVVLVSGEVALEQLRTILLIGGGAFLILTPLLAWYLTERTLKPVEAANASQKKFVSDAAHELRTPLAILSGEMQVAIKKRRKIKDYQDLIKSSREEVDRLTLLMDDLLFLSRHTISSYRSQFKKVDITDVLSIVVSNFKKRLRQKHILLKFIPPEELVSVKGDEEMLITLFNNLVDNAIKYSEKGGKVKVMTWPNKKMVTVSITDNGIGISKTEINKIFTRFYRSEKTRHLSRGFGLGLSIVDAITKAHRGTIKVISQLHRGSTFLVNLPRA